MTTFKILCMACNSYLFDTDTVRLHFPLSGEMFDPVVKGFTLRPGYLRLEIFCPVCSAFPFSHDGSKKGFKGVGRLVKTVGPDGRPKVMDISDLTAAHWPEIEEHASPEEVKEATQRLFEQCKPEPPAAKTKNKTKKAKANPAPDWLIKKVEAAPNFVSPEAPPTSEELRELMRDREARSVRSKDDLLRLLQE